MIKDGDQSHYMGTLVEENGELGMGFALDEKLTLISFVDFANDKRINAPAKTMLDFNKIDERVIDLF